MPSVLDDATRALETRLAAAFPTTPIAWPNVEFAAPQDALYLRAWVLWGAGSLFTMAPRRSNQVLGIYQVSIYAPLAHGAGAALAVGDQVRDVYNRVDLGLVRCDAPSGPVALPPEPPWYGCAVSIPFAVVEDTA